MRSHWRLCLLALLAGGPAGAAEKTGTIRGVIRYTGPMPAPKKVQTNDGPLVYRELFVDAKSKGLRYVVAILEDAPAQPRLKKAKPAVMDQSGMLFVPRVLAVQHGQPVRFDNSDSANHGVMASSPLRANQFNVITPPGQPCSHVFEPQKHPVLIGCPLHAWMRAWVFVLPHPWFAVSDDQGKFHIKEVPAGKYTLLLRHPDTGHLERRTVEVKAGAMAEVAVEWKKIDP